MSARLSAQPTGAFPYWPLAVTMAMQAFATAAAYAVPSLAPVIARDLGIDGALSGYFVALIYTVGITSSLMAADLIHRFGAVRVCQLVLLASIAMLLVCASGHVAGLALGAIVLGTIYGATAPVSAHLLVPRTPLSSLNLVLSIRQISVPLGAMLVALLLPPLALRLGWQAALLALAVPLLALMLALQWPRRHWDVLSPARPSVRSGSLAGVKQILATSAELRHLTAASFMFQGVQGCFVAFTTVLLTSRAGFDLIAAAQALAVFHGTGLLSRPLWGWLADRFGSARILLAAMGCVMGAASIAAGFFSTEWPVALVIVVTAIAGATANGGSGIAYAEYARLGGTRRTEATGVGSAAMFGGMLFMPAVGAALVPATGGYLVTFAVAGTGALVAGLALGLSGRSGRTKAPAHQ